MLHWNVGSQTETKPTETSNGSYFSSWYAKNKLKLKEKRKKKYDHDPEYKKKALKNAEKNRAAKREKPPDGYNITLTMVSNVLQVTPDTLREWRKGGFYPEPLFCLHRFWFTENQLSLLMELKKFLIEGNGRKDTVGLESQVSLTYANWN